MNQFRPVWKSILVIAVLVLFGTAGCAFSLFPKPGAIAHNDNRIPLVDGAGKSGTVETGDLHLDYSIKADGSSYQLSGKVEIDQSITYTFSKLKSLVIKMSFLDDNGMVLQNVDITPLVKIHGAIKEEMDLNKSGPIPAGSSAVAFSWYGSFYAGFADVSGSWDIHYFPFDRQ